MSDNELYININQDFRIISRYNFDEWWDPDEFDLEKHSDYLCECIPQKFDVWWNPEKFNWKDFSFMLAEYLPDKFDIWWNPEKFVWIFYYYSMIYIDHSSIESMCKHLLHRISTWYIPQTYKLNIYNSKYIINKKTNTDILTKYIDNLEWDYD